ncbi:hydantoinase B/oxoprolinase family protein [Microvirga antarctica]|uniref:hydantoinase B/oxoprolinase family protein n=1 Tax=Microvirga antarctica TaxID=2819233 RepID=UPI001B317662|nr:hydantoinase B/oxoprolinase family protein [Microvirga antarctica]
MDPVLTEIMKNRFTAMAEEAATVAYRTAHTTFVKQTQDFQVALASLSGEFFAYPTMTGVTSGSGQSIAGFLNNFDLAALIPGDVLISNDPFQTGGLVTHQMDIHLVRPVFVGGTLICFAWSFVHASDIGGAVPGSISPDLTECFQEGLRLRPMKLVDAGEMNTTIRDILRDNSRIGDAVWGDIEALMAAMRLLNERVVLLSEKVGVESFQTGIENVLSYADQKARAVIGRLRDGTYHFADYLETDSADDAINIQCRLTIAGSEAAIDYSGSSPQVHAALNFGTGSRTHPFLCLALTNYIQTVEPSIPINGGILRSITAYAPPGTIMNAEFPAAMGNRWVAVMRTYDALLGCLNQAIDGGIAACGAGQAGIISASWIDPQTGRNRVTVVEPFSGGSGGRVRADGVDATDTMIGYLKSTPIEHVEVETPLIVRRHELVSSAFGHGRFRGGAAVCIELECRAPEVKITVRGLDRFRFQPWGAFGGEPGHNGRTFLVRDGEARPIGKIKVLTMLEGDVLRMISPCGGGFGDAFARAPESVLRDVLDELLTAEQAADNYGVVVLDGRVDGSRTRALREARPRSDQRWQCSAGAEQQRYEAIWPAETSGALSDAVLKVPIGLRRIVLERSRRELASGKVPIGTDRTRQVVEQVSRRFQGRDDGHPDSSDSV